MIYYILSKNLYGFKKINGQHDIENDIVFNDKPAKLVFAAEKENGSIDATGYFSRSSARGLGYLRMDNRLTTDKTIVNATMEEKK